MDEVTATTTTQTQPEATEPKPLRERLEAIVDQHSEAEAADPAAAQAPATDGDQAPQTGSEQAAETPVQEPEKIEVTADQLADSKYWGALDAEGWKRMERDYPVQTKFIKSAQAAATRIVNDARRADPNGSAAQPQSTRTDQPSDDEPSEEFVAEVETVLSELDPKKAAKGLLKIIRSQASTIAKEIGVDPNRNRAEAVFAQALTSAVEQHADIAKFMQNDADRAALDEIADSRPELNALISTGTAENIAIAMVAAGKDLSARKQSEANKVKQAEIDKKAKETRQIVQSNARPASAEMLAPHGANPPGKPPLSKRLSDKYDQVVGSQN
jgi:hypothetical protein